LAKPASLVCAAQAQVVRWGSRPDALDSFTLAVASDSYTAADFATCVGATYAPRADAFANLSSHALRCGCVKDLIRERSHWANRSRWLIGAPSLWPFPLFTAPRHAACV
jgi:hypothetical protein